MNLNPATTHADTPHDSAIPPYRELETLYGPELVRNDWRLTQGQLNAFPMHAGSLRRHFAQEGPGRATGLYWASHHVQLFTNEPATLTRIDSGNTSGGDVAVRVDVSIERMSEDGHVEICFNDAHPRADADPAFRVRFEDGGVTAYHRDDRLFEQPWELEGERRGHTIELVTLGRNYALSLDGEQVADGSYDVRTQDNEGWFHIRAEGAGLTLRGFEETAIAHDKPAPAWSRSELLYEASFDEASLEEDWVVNGPAPHVRDGAFQFRHMSVGMLRERFEGPIAVEINARPMTMDAVSSIVTDAIFIWMMDKPDGDLFEYLESLDNASRSNYLDLPFYWMDMGGSNNITTRLRRNPHLQLVRQFIDADRLLEPGRRYTIQLVQHGHFFEYWVDGELWIRAWDPDPLTEGHVGFRSYVGGAEKGTASLEVSGLRVWRIAPAE